jgi:RHS repeat-associated protein
VRRPRQLFRAAPKRWLLHTRYDANGNRTNTGYVTGDNNQLLEDANYTYVYDAEGNRVSREDKVSGEVTTYEWDHRNRLIKVTTWEDDTLTTATQIVAYGYDVFDRRISRQVDNTGTIDLVGEAIERMVYDGDNVILDFLDADGDGENAVVAKRYLHGAVVDQIMAEEAVDELISDPERVVWHFADNLLTVRALADNAGDIVEHLQYDSFGNVVTASAHTRYHFTGRELEVATGLQYNRARWYDPAVGRWISEDPIGFKGGMNLSEYVNNNPITLVDPSGLQFIGPCAACLRPSPIFAPPRPISPPRPVPLPPRPAPPRPVPLPPDPVPPIPVPPGRDIPAPAPRPIPSPTPPGPGDPPHPGDTMNTPPGDCHWNEYNALRRAVMIACRKLPGATPIPVCTGNTLFTSCDALRDAARQHTKCADARKALDDKCFRGGNAGHRYQRAMERWHASICWYKYDWWGCGCKPLPQPPIA